MTGRIEKTVFISYRRTNLPWALFVYQNLTMHGYDVFFDYQSIDSGNFETVILDNIKARAHFIIILTPSALENCNKPGDWLRREIETAIVENRNIVPLMVENFDFGSAYAKEALTGKLAKLSTYNGLPIPNAYALEAMERLRERYLNKVVINIPTPVMQSEAQKITEKQKIAADEAAPVTEEQLTAQLWFERGYVFADNGSVDEAIRCFSEAIRLQPDLASAYYNRGTAYGKYKGDMESAIADFDQTLRIQPNRTEAIANRGIARLQKGDQDGAISDLTQAIALNPETASNYLNLGIAYGLREDNQKAIDYITKAIQLNENFLEAYSSRGLILYLRGDLDGALSDYDKAIAIKSDDIEVLRRRGSLYKEIGKLNEAIKDYEEIAQLNPNYADVYYHRAAIWERKKNFPKAIADYQKFLEVGDAIEENTQGEVEAKIKKLKNKLAKQKPTKKKPK